MENISECCRRIVTHRFCGFVISAAMLGLVGCGGGGGSIPAIVLTPGPSNDITITAPPLGQSVQVGDTVTFSVSALGAAPISYQWYRNGAALSGATTSSYTINQASGVNNQDKFNVRLINSTNATGLSSASASLTVKSGNGIDLLAGCATLINKVVSLDGKGSAATLSSPQSVATDASGNVLVADGFGVRRITSDGTVSTVLSQSDVRLIAVAGDGTIYFSGSSSGSIQKLSPNGTLSSWVPFYPTGLAVDAAGSVYASEGSGGIYKISPSGNISIFAGASGRTGSKDGSTADASFFGPAGLAFDANGNLYVADAGNHTVRKITPQGQVSTLAGTVGVIGALDGKGTGAQFLAPYTLTADKQGNLYIADGDGVRKLTPDGNVKHFAGTPGAMGYADGASSTALFNQSTGVALDAAGNLYVADRLNNVIRLVNASGDVATFAGHAASATLVACSGSNDGDGFTARFNLPAGIAQDGSGNLYVADGANYTIRKITPTGVVTTLVGLAGVRGSVDGAANAARFYSPKGMAFDRAGNLYIADDIHVRMISPSGNVTTVDSPQGMWNISSVAFDGAGNLYVVGQINVMTNSSSIYRKAIDGTVTWIGSNSGPVAADLGGSVYAVQLVSVGGSLPYCISPYCTSHYALGKFGADGRFSELAQVPEAANGLAIDPVGNFYISGQYAIYKVTPTGVVTTLAGQALNFSVGTRLGSLPGSLYSPTAMTVVTSGGVSRLMVTDFHAILSILTVQQ